MIEKYAINFQYLPKNSARPLDDGQTIECESDNNGFMLVPNVGDFVQLIKANDDDAEMSGKVKSRLFTYIGKYCSVNIVVEETDDDWGKLIKE